MFKSLKRWWKYLGAKLNNSFNENADPKIQLEQAIAEAQDQHRRLKEQAANVIANQKQNEMRLNDQLEELEKLNRNAQQAVLMADEAARSGDAAKAERVHHDRRGDRQPADRQGEGGREPQVHVAAGGSGRRPGQGGGAAELPRPAAEAVREAEAPEPARPGQDAGADEHGHVVADRAVGQDVPTLEEVREKIEPRYAKAKGMAELQDSSVESKMLEVEQASMNVEAQARLVARSAPSSASSRPAADAAPAPAADQPEAARGAAARRRPTPRRPSAPPTERFTRLRVDQSGDRAPCSASREG